MNSTHISKLETVHNRSGRKNVRKKNIENNTQVDGKSQKFFITCWWQ